MPILRANQITKVQKPWGYEVVWAMTESYVGKLLHIRRGEAINRHYHNEKQETLHLLAGTVLLTLQTGTRMEVKTMAPAEAYQIPPGLIHWLEAMEDSSVLEVTSSGLDDLVSVAERPFCRGSCVQ